MAWRVPRASPSPWGAYPQRGRTSCSWPRRTRPRRRSPASILETGARIIDLSGAFRSRDAETHAAWYGFAHPRAALLSQAVYAVPELLADRAAQRTASLIANPGCYATAMILALAPILPLLHTREAVVADCKSGVSGAGKRAELAYSFTELAGNFKAYATTGHRHEPEVRRALGWSDARPFEFVPHLLPVARGILATLHVPLETSVEAERVAARYAAAYGNAPFVGVRAHGELPSLSDVVGTPRCEIGFQLLRGGRRLLVVSVLDNLLKGAASQAVQNLNLAFGFAEAEGLN